MAVMDCPRYKRMCAIHTRGQLPHQNVTTSRPPIDLSRDVSGAITERYRGALRKNNSHATAVDARRANALRLQVPHRRLPQRLPIRFWRGAAELAVLDPGQRETIELAAALPV